MLCYIGVALRFVLSLLILGFPLVGFSGLERCNRPAASLEGEWRFHRVGDFILSFTLSGPHALNRAGAMNENAVPTVVDDVSKQLLVVRGLLKQTGFKLPLESLRYREQGAQKILVRFRKLEANGMAYDEVTRLSTGECVLTIDVSTRYKTGNATPAHEFFHLVQNGYAMFKRPWYYEGLARWAESSVSKREIVLRPLSGGVASTSLFQESYSAETAWNTLIKSCDPSEVDLSTYGFAYQALYSDGSSVVRNDKWRGIDFVRRLLEDLSSLSLQVSNEMGLNPADWPERLQRDARWDHQIWISVEQVCASLTGKSLLRLPWK